MITYIFTAGYFNDLDNVRDIVSYDRFYFDRVNSKTREGKFCHCSIEPLVDMGKHGRIIILQDIEELVL